MSVSGALPTGVTFNPATGVLSGTPGLATAGDYNLIFTAANGTSPNATQSFTLHVAPPPAFTINDVTQMEGNSGTTSILFTVSKTGTTAASVQFSTAPGTANPAIESANCTAVSTDYQDTSGTLSFAAGETTKAISVPVCGNTVKELNDTFVVTLANPTGATISESQGVGTITDDDTLILAIGDVVRAEGNSGPTTFSFTVSKTGTTDLLTTVDYATAAGTMNPARAGGCATGIDYQSASGTLSIPAGSSSGSVSITVCGDGSYELNDTFAVNLTSPTNATIGDAQGLGTITNDDALTLTIDDVTRSEGNLGTTAFTFTVSKTGTTELVTTVDYATASGTTNPATVGACGAGIDYESASGTLSIPAADASGTVSVTMCGDATYEAIETFVVNLSNPVNATIGDAQAVGTISNDDTLTLAVSDVTAAKGHAAATTFTFTVSKTGTTDLVTTVAYAAALGTMNPATVGVCGAGIDYQASSGSLTIPAANPSGTFSVTVCGDATYELNETFVWI